MLLSIVLFNGLLFASLARGVPFGIGSKPIRRQTETPLELAVVSISSPGITFSSIAGELLVPLVTGQPGDMVKFMMGLDVADANCKSGSFQIGVGATIGQDNNTKYTALYRDPSLGYEDERTIESFTVSAGDSVYMAVAVDPNDMAFGAGVIASANSLSVKDVTFSAANPSRPLCGESAGWFIEMPVEEIESSNHLQFGAVIFLNADANTTTEGMLYPNSTHAKISNPDDNTVLGSVEGRMITFCRSA